MDGISEYGQCGVSLKFVRVFVLFCVWLSLLSSTYITGLCHAHHTLPSFSLLSHALGVHDEYHLVLRAIDEAIGNYVEAVQAASAYSYKSFTFAVISDHVCTV